MSATRLEESLTVGVRILKDGLQESLRIGPTSARRGSDNRQSDPESALQTEILVAWPERVFLSESAARCRFEVCYCRLRLGHPCTPLAPVFSYAVGWG